MSALAPYEVGTLLGQRSGIDPLEPWHDNIADQAHQIYGT